MIYELRSWIRTTVIAVYYFHFKFELYIIYSHSYHVVYNLFEFFSQSSNT